MTNIVSTHLKNGILSTINKVVVIGNSVGLRIRPRTANNNDNKVYSSILEELLNKEEHKWSVLNMSLSRLLTAEALSNKDLYIREFPSFYIINLGCVDAPNRDVPLWFSNIITERKEHFMFNIFSFFYNNILKRFRRQLVFLRFKRPWVSPKKFKKQFVKLLKVLNNETNAKIIVIGINKGNRRIDSLLPGTNERYISYNKILKEICTDNTVSFIDMSDLTSSMFYPDGIHYNIEGHQQVANRLFNKIHTYSSFK